MCFATSSPAACDFALRSALDDTPIDTKCVNCIGSCGRAGKPTLTCHAVFIWTASVHPLRDESAVPQDLVPDTFDGVGPCHRRLAEISVEQLWQP